jgi:hypothetical protein
VAMFTENVSEMSMSLYESVQGDNRKRVKHLGRCAGHDEVHVIVISFSYQYTQYGWQSTHHRPIDMNVHSRNSIFMVDTAQKPERKL